MRKSVRTLAIAASAVILGLGTTTAGALSSSVTLDVDGQTHRVWGFAPTVATLLSDEGVVLTTGDLVQPALPERVITGSTITVKYQRLIHLTIDGQTQDLTTNEPTLAAALAATGRPDYATSRFSFAKDELLPRGEQRVSITTPKAVSITDGKATKDLNTTAPDVATLLAETGYGASATSYPEPSTLVSNKLKIAVGQIETKTETKREGVPFSTETGEAKDLFKGETRVTQKGKAGEIDRDYTTVTVNGVEFLTHVTAERLVAEPIVHKVAKGTRTAGQSGKGIDLRREAEWNRIARCESGNRWNINTGNGYYGGLQFNTQSWNSNGGRDFAPRADLATREQQITVANRYADRSGFRPWSCKP